MTHFWQNNSGGRFRETAGTVIWGPDWHRTHADKVEAVLVLGVPTEALVENSGATFSIPEPLLTVDETVRAKYYANAYEKAFYSGSQVEPSFREFGISVGYSF